MYASEAGYLLLAVILHQRLMQHAAKKGTHDWPKFLKDA